MRLTDVLLLWAAWGLFTCLIGLILARKDGEVFFDDADELLSGLFFILLVWPAFLFLIFYEKREGFMDFLNKERRIPWMNKPKS